ncbi:MAG TPA: FixH family protein [Candidatus Baltobacteraceae bacterium]|nr:FixH family protein [Candidatus Baltobacteraceae bacterium]
MQRLVVGLLALILAAPLAGCSGAKKPVASTAAQAPYSIDLTFDPTPPQVGTEKFVVTLRDATGAPVTGAKVQIFPSYESVPGGHLVAKTGMGGVSATLDATDAGDGTYDASMVLAKPVYWTFNAQATLGDRIVSVQRGVQVGQ